jgi:ABC-2 type transport system ATP-binding protein
MGGHDSPSALPRSAPAGPAGCALCRQERIVVVGAHAATGLARTAATRPPDPRTPDRAVHTEQLNEEPHTDSPHPLAVEVADLVKRYPKAPKDSLAGVSFDVERGEVFGFLGPNGAGKTTTIGILTTRIRPTRGSARVAGVDVVADPVGAKRVLGVVPQQNNLDRSLSVRQNLLFHASYHGVPRPRRNRLADELLEQFGLADRPGGKPDDFSGGQIQRMMIARALMHAPAVLFLDEPSTGLDPAARLFLWEKVAELREGGTTVVITTHDMDEAATLSDRVAIIDHGVLLALDTPAALVRSMPSDRSLDCTIEHGPEGEPASVGKLVAVLEGVGQVEQLEDPTGTGWRFRVYVHGEAAPYVAPVAHAVEAAGARLTDVRLGEPNLEDVFIHLTGRALR